MLEKQVPISNVAVLCPLLDLIGDVTSVYFFLLSDNSDRAFFKELVKVVESSDVILEVLDARDPLGTRCVDMEKMVRRLGPEKHLVLLLNKIGIVYADITLVLCYKYCVTVLVVVKWLFDK